LQEAIDRYPDGHNREPEPFVGTAEPDAIAEKVRLGYHDSVSIERQAG
jgi:hypothetical protein